MESDLRIAVAGAGAIGCFVGGLLAAAGRDVTLLARPRIGQEIRAHGLTLTDFNGMAHKVDADSLTVSDKPSCLAKADIILATVKSDDTGAIARIIAAHASAKAQIVSLQNGTENTDILRAVLPDRDVRAGTVPFNVVPMGQGCFHRASSGDILIGTGGGAGADAMADLLSVPGVLIKETDKIIGLQWGRFLINLNNALNALSGLTLQNQLHDRAWRALIADQWVEATRVLKASNIQPISGTHAPIGAIPTILRLPTPLFSRVAAPMLEVDAQARTSMSHDLMMGRKTEIDALQGQVVRLGAQSGLATPISSMVIEVMELAETAGEGLPNLPLIALRREIECANP